MGIRQPGDYDLLLWLQKIEGGDRWEIYVRNGRGMHRVERWERRPFEHAPSLAEMVDAVQTVMGEHLF